MCARRAWAAERERGPASVCHHMATIWPTYVQHMSNIRCRAAPPHRRGTFAGDQEGTTPRQARERTRARAPPPAAAGGPPPPGARPQSSCLSPCVSVFRRTTGFVRDQPQRAHLPRPSRRCARDRAAQSADVAGRDRQRRGGTWLSRGAEPRSGPFKRCTQLSSTPRGRTRAYSPATPPARNDADLVAAGLTELGGGFVKSDAAQRGYKGACATTTSNSQQPARHTLPTVPDSSAAQVGGVQAPRRPAR